MAKIEIDENEYAEMKRVADVARLIGQNPTAREKLQEAVALAAPDQAGPEIRIRKEVNDRVGGIEQKLDAWLAAQNTEKEERATERARRTMENQWTGGRKLARDSGYTEDGLKALEDFMEKEGVASHKIAMAAYERENPPPEPVSTGGSRWDFFGAPSGDAADINLDALMKGNDEAFLQQAIPAALKDVRGR